MPLLRDAKTSEPLFEGNLYSIVLKAEELGFENVLFDSVPHNPEDPGAFDPQPYIDQAHALQDEIKSMRKAPKKNADRIEEYEATLGTLEEVTVDLTGGPVEDVPPPPEV